MLKLKIIIISLIVIIVAVIVYNYNQLPTDTINVSKPTGTAVKITGPKIEVAPTFFDLGDAVYGEVAEHTFTVKNLGGEPLEILRLSTSCGCTTAEIAEQDKVIAPGQSVEMKVSFEPAVMAEPISGQVERVVYIKTNDPDRPEVEVDLRANVISNN